MMQRIYLLSEVLKYVNIGNHKNLRQVFRNKKKN